MRFSAWRVGEFRTPGWLARRPDWRQAPRRCVHPWLSFLAPAVLALALGACAEAAKSPAPPTLSTASVTPPVTAVVSALPGDTPSPTPTEPAAGLAPTAAVPSDTPVTATPTPGATAAPEAGGQLSYEGWQTYSDATYGFALRYPPGWLLSADNDPTSTTAGHRLQFWAREQPDIVLTIGFKRTAEERFIGRTGVGSGECVQKGMVTILGQPEVRRALVCQGKDMTVIYGLQPEIRRAGLSFTIYLDYRGSCNDATALSAEAEATADAIAASLNLTE